MNSREEWRTDWPLLGAWIFILGFNAFLWYVIYLLTWSLFF